MLFVSQRTPLHNAATEGHLSVVKYLVRKRAQVDSKDIEDVRFIVVMCNTSSLVCESSYIVP